jgi:predicted cation transporter
MAEPLLIASLAGILGLVLVLPFAVRRVEEEIEAFLLVMGVLAVTASGLWSQHLVAEALWEPVKISAAVLVFGCLFRASRGLIQRHVAGLARRAGRGPFLFGVVVALGVLSSVITAIVASLVLVEVISALRLAKDRERAVVVYACYGIGLGAVLTPLGEPLATVATARLAGPPHQADFFFLARLLWPWVAAGILAAGLLASRCAGGPT